MHKKRKFNERNNFSLLILIKEMNVCVSDYSISFFVGDNKDCVILARDKATKLIVLLRKIRRKKYLDEANDGIRLKK